MNFINQTAIILPPYDSISEAELLKRIELCGRVCYKSEDKITEGSAAKFVTGILKSGHHSVLEHGTIGIKLTRELVPLTEKAMTCPYLFTKHDIPEIILYGNVRAWRNFFIEHIAVSPYYIFKYAFMKFKKKYPALFSDLDVVAVVPDVDLGSIEFVPVGELRPTIHWVTNRGISHELVRHRVFSFSQESTRWCNYSQSRFGNELTFIRQTYLKGKHDFDKNGVTTHIPDTYLLFQKIEDTYFTLLDEGWTAQEARSILPNDLKTELMMTGSMFQWDQFFELRTKPDVHPQLLELTIPLFKELKSEKVPTISDTDSSLH